MQKTLKNWNSYQLGWLLIIFSGLYLGLAFPRSYFRHDDWLIIGNVARFTPESWKFLFEPYLIFNSIKEVWFFRPWFKLMVFLNYCFLGYHYFAWLTLNLIFTLGALILGYLSIKELSSNFSQGLLFVAFFVSSVHFHFGSLVWVGEGAMNCPQLFFLFLNGYLFSKAIRCPKKSSAISYYFSAFIAFVISLGFKESSIFHLPFLLVILFHPQNNPLSQKSRFWLFFPYIISTTIYLAFRLFYLPINPGYTPHLEIQLIVKPILFLLGSLVLPVLAITFANSDNQANLRNTVKVFGSMGWYLLLFFPFFIIYMGHGFFSPGWLLTPGMYLAYLIGLKFPLLFYNRKTIRLSLFTTLIFSSLLVFYQTQSLKWWLWYKPQRQLVKIIDEAGSSSTQLIRLFNCEKPEQNHPSLIRVVGYNVSIQELFWLKHKTLPKVKILPCAELEHHLTAATENSINLKWEFPELTNLNP